MGMYTELADRIQATDFGHVFRVVDGQLIDDVDGSRRENWAPDVYHDDEQDIVIDAAADGWRALTGLTGQYSYNGACMHPSEFVGERIAEVIAEHATDNPGAVFALAVVEVLPDDEEDDPEPAGWAILYRDESR